MPVMLNEVRKVTVSNLTHQSRCSVSKISVNRIFPLVNTAGGVGEREGGGRERKRERHTHTGTDTEGQTDR